MGLFNWLFSDYSKKTTVSTYEDALIRAREIQDKKDEQVQRAIRLYNQAMRDFLNVPHSDTSIKGQFIVCSGVKVHRLFNDYFGPSIHFDGPDSQFSYIITEWFKKASTDMIKVANYPAKATLSVSPLIYEHGCFLAWVYLTTASEE
tara:strand:- start:14 stop:454 length:441 start_codon:yes stop_codon:yes gene_type:complete